MENIRRKIKAACLEERGGKEGRKRQNKRMVKERKLNKKEKVRERKEGKSTRRERE